MAKKLKQIEVEEKLKSQDLLLFSAAEFRDVFGVPTATASSFINRNLARGLFLKLRNGLYQLRDSNPSAYQIANRLYRPSYVSLEKALSHYRIIPETVYTITSVTTKPTREFATARGTFSYQRIKRSAFTGYSLVQIGRDSVHFAEPEKALADYLYFVDLGRVSLNDRLNLKPIVQVKLRRYARLFGRPGMLRLIDHVYAERGKPRAIR